VAVSDRAGPDVDELTVARLTGAARRHAPGREPTEEETAAAVEELREIAGDRADLLAEVAGLLLGFYRRTVEELKAQAAAQYCISAGADPDLIPQWIEVGWRRAAVARQARYPGPEVNQLPRQPGAAGQRKRLAPGWRSRAGRHRWWTFRFNV
jgi:hypothetical protein